MKKLLLFATVLFVFFNASVAQKQVTLVSAKQNETILNIKIDEYYLKNIKTPKGEESIVYIPDANQIIKKGAPNLPKIVSSVIIPDRERMKVEVISGEYKEITDVKIAPSKGHFLRSQDPESIPYVYGEWYDADAFYPGELAHLNSPYIIRDFRGQAVDIYPFQYNPATNTLRVYSEITVVISSTGEKGENVFERKRALESVNREFHNIYERRFVNYGKLHRYTPVEEDGDMLIISHDEYMAPMEAFIDWKATIGLNVEMVGTSTTGTTWQEIDSYITNYYNNNNLKYVLFVGDAEHIPPVPSGGTSVIDGYSDQYYTYLAGDDRYSDIFIGRFSAESIADVETQVQRTIEYEQAYSMEDGWLNHALGLARDEGSGQGHDGGEADDEHMENIRDRLLDYNYDVVYQEYDGNSNYVDYNTTAANISDRINSGVGVINFCNHGSVTGWSVGGYDIGDVNNLTNTNKLPFVWSVACVVGDFQGQTCFAETWLRATHNGEPTGAIAHFGSTINQPWHPPMDAQDEFNRILTQMFENNIKKTFGGISVNGVYDMLDKNNNSWGHRTAETWTIFGDPSVKVRTDDAIDMAVEHDPDIMLGLDYFEITVDTEDAFAALTKDNQIISAANEEDGIIYLAIDEGIDIGDNVTIAITAYNKIPYINNMEVVEAGAYANFTAEPREVLQGEYVTFTCTSDPDDGEFETWEWDFGAGADPATATGEGPHVVTYNTPGDKTVSLLIDGEYKRLRESYITVNDIATLTVYVNGSGSVKINGEEYYEPVDLAKNSTNILEAISGAPWDFINWKLDGEVVSEQQELVYTMPDKDVNLTANFIETGFENNTVVVNNVNAEPGEQITIEVEVENEDVFVAFQMDFELPDGFNFVYDSPELSDRATDHSIGSNVMEENVLRLIAYSMNNENFTGNSGLLFSFDLETPYEDGTWELRPEEITITNADYQNIYTGYVPGTITLSTPPYIDSIAPVNDITVRFGTNQEEAISQLDSITTIYDQYDGEYIVELQWEIEDYDGELPGECYATGNFELPGELNQSDPETPFEVTATITVLPEPYILTLLQEPVDAGTLTGEGRYTVGDTVTVRAEADDSYIFARWNYEDGELFSYHDSLTFKMPDNDLTLIALFEIIYEVEDVDPLGLSIFPVPARNELFIQAEVVIKKVSIADLRGSAVYHKEAINSREYRLNISQFEPGFYLIRLTTEKGDIRYKIQVQ